MRCTRCRIDKAIDDFAWRNATTGVRHKVCKVCHRELTKEHYHNGYKPTVLKRNAEKRIGLVAMIHAIKEKTPCADCGTRYPYYVMDFDHREGEVKQFDVARAARLGSNAALKEIKKCDVVCSNCHRERTHKRRNNGRLAKMVKAPVLETGISRFESGGGYQTTESSAGVAGALSRKQVAPKGVGFEPSALRHLMKPDGWPRGKAPAC